METKTESCIQKIENILTDFESEKITLNKAMLLLFALVGEEKQEAINRFSEFLQTDKIK